MVDRTHWRSQASASALLARADLYRKIREFFYQRQVLEVETPALSRFANPDPNIHSLAVSSPLQGGDSVTGFLHTSPEFAMKRLLAGGSGAIYQICKVFRGREQGRLHNPEFSMLEWYRPGFSLQQLMDEVEQLVRCALPNLGPCEKLTYAELFYRHFSIDPHQATPAQLQSLARQHELHVLGMEDAKIEAWFDLLFSHILQPTLGQDRCSFVYDFPVSQCALARLNQHPRSGAARFELIVNGVELANGYDELRDAVEMRRRFEHDQAVRRAAANLNYPYDEWVLAAIEAGLPESCGVALGLDRLLMLQQGAQHINEILSFGWAQS